LCSYSERHLSFVFTLRMSNFFALFTQFFWRGVALTGNANKYRRSTAGEANVRSRRSPR